MKIQNKGAVLVQIAPLFISQPRNQNQSINYGPGTGPIFTLYVSPSPRTRRDSIYTSGSLCESGEPLYILRVAWPGR